MENYRKIKESINELSIEGLFYYLAFIKKLNKQNQSNNRLLKQDCNFDKDYIEVLNFTYNKIITISKNIDSQKYRYSFINQNKHNKEIIEEWKKLN